MTPDFLIQYGIQVVLGVLAVAMVNPASTTFNRFKKSLRTLRDTLNTLPLDEPSIAVPMKSLQTELDRQKLQ